METGVGAPTDSYTVFFFESGAFQLGSRAALLEYYHSTMVLVSYYWIPYQFLPPYRLD